MPLVRSSKRWRPSTGERGGVVKDKSVANPRRSGLSEGEIDAFIDGFDTYCDEQQRGLKAGAASLGTVSGDARVARLQARRSGERAATNVVRGPAWWMGYEMAAQFQGILLSGLMAGWTPDEFGEYVGGPESESGMIGDTLDYSSKTLANLTGIKLGDKGGLEEDVIAAGRTALVGAIKAAMGTP